MYLLPTSDYDLVRPFFPQGTAGRSFVFAHLEHNHTGHIYVDNLETPQTILTALTCEFYYVAGGAVDAGTLGELRNLLANDLAPQDDYVLVFPTSPAWQSTLEEMFSNASELHHAARKEYHFDAARYDELHRDWNKRVPADFEIRRYDHALTEGTELEPFWGGIDAFLERGFGYAVTKGDEIISRCHAVMIGDREVEISIETAEAYRRQGFAKLAACAFIDHCRTHDLTPAWSCWDYNAPSQAMAESLGFVHRGDTPALVIKIA